MDLFKYARVFKNLITKKPILIIFDVTKLCNQTCNMCDIPSRANPKYELNMEEISSMLKQLKKFGVGYAFLQGGDPLVRKKDIKEIVLECIKYSIKPTIITNGILLTPDLLTFIANNDCNLSISIDSLDPHTYKEIRGVNTLKKVMNNIELAKDYKRKGNWAITTTITNINYKHVAELDEYAEEKGFMYAIRPYTYNLNNASHYDDKLALKDVNPIIEVFEEQIRKDRKRNFLASLVYEEHIRFLKGVDIGRCDAMERSFCLSDVGDYTPCIEHHNKIFSTRFDDLNDNFDSGKRRLKKLVKKCYTETPCSYNDAREIGVIWSNKKRILMNLPHVIKPLIRHNNFF